MDGRTRGPYRAAMRRVLALALVALAGGAGVAAGLAAVELTRPTPPHWTDPGAHVVDGRWFGAATACPLDARRDCSLAVDAALERAAIIEPEATVTSASLSRPVGAYTNGRGGTVLATTSGMVDYKYAMLELADGRRLIIGVVCTPEMVSTDGTVPSSCDWDAGEVTAPRVGAEPWLYSD